MSSRRRVREIVLQILYQQDLNPTFDADRAEEFLVRRMRAIKPLCEFGRKLLAGIRQDRKAIDDQISQSATNWSIRRMAAIDRNILRIGTYEIVTGGTPGRVAINEAVELAKRYGDKNSGQFVNGILDKVLRDQQSSAKQDAVESDSSDDPTSVSTSTT